MAYAKEHEREKQTAASARYYEKVHRVTIQIPETSWEEITAYAASMGVAPGTCIKACLARCMEKDTGHAPSMHVSKSGESD